MKSAVVIRAFLVALFATALFPCAVMANPSVVQYKACSTVGSSCSTIALTSTPTAGNVVAMMAAGAGVGNDPGNLYFDPSGNPLLIQANPYYTSSCAGQSNCASVVQAYTAPSGLASGSYHSTSGCNCAGVGGMEISGVNGVLYTSTTGTSTTATLSGVPSGAIIGFAVSQTGSSSVPTLSNAGTVTYLNNYSSGSNLDVSGFATASSSASVTLTLGSGASSASVISLVAFYEYSGSAISVVHTCSQSSTSCVFAAAPANGSEVVGGQFGTSLGAGCNNITDSNSVVLVQRYNAGESCGNDYVVSGTPTATYTCNSGAACALINVTGAAIPGTYATNTGAAATSTTASITTKAGDYVVCTGGSSQASTFSNTGFSGGVVAPTFLPNSPSAGIMFAQATAPTTSCTTTNPNISGGTTFVGLADYTAAATTTSGCPPFPFPCVFQQGYAPLPQRNRTPVLADLLR